MSVKPLPLLLLSSLLTVPLFAQTPCAAQKSHAGWRVYSDPALRFCLLYPDSYEPASTAAASGAGQPLARFSNAQTQSSIDLLLQDGPFSLPQVRKFAPTGLIDPEPVRIGSQSFLYYGPGGGGVAYPDLFFVKVAGKILQIGFDGPYRNSKTPAPSTKQIEPEVLATFRSW